MSHASALIADDIEAYLEQHERKELLRFLTCGSVDDGKSTLIGRLLYDSKLLYEDQLAAIRKESAARGRFDAEFDPSLVTDGLKAEREQGITIDVAYRYFSTAKRKFIIADTPGHEQYTRNMATGASNCDLAVILIDARHGVVTQTRRHSFIVSLLGIKHVVVAVNKMDLVNYDETVFNQIQSAFASFAAKLEIRDISFIPLAALHGDNVVEPSANMPWYQGSTLMHFLENVHIASDRNLIDFRLPVQYVNRPHQDFRGYCGTIASGIVRPGDEVMVLPSRKTSRVASIHAYEGALNEARSPMAVTVTLEDEVDVSRGDVLAHPGNLPRTDESVEAMVVWMGEEPMELGHRYTVKHLTRYTGATISRVRYRMDVNSLHRQPGNALRLNEIGRCTIELGQPIAYDSYARNRASGAFIIIDRMSNGTVAAGMIIERTSEESRGDHWDTAPRSAALSRQPSRVSAAERHRVLQQDPRTVLLTGLSGSGKSTLAYALERRLFDRGQHATVIDGQNMRLGLSRDLGFSSEDRSEALRRGAEVARMMNDAGLVCILAYVAPSQEVRNRARDAVGAESFVVVHLDAPLEVCRARDSDGVYELADAEEGGTFPGVNAPYDPPEFPDLCLDTSELSVEDCVDRVVALLDAPPGRTGSPVAKP